MLIINPEQKRAAKKQAPDIYAQEIRKKYPIEFRNRAYNIKGKTMKTVLVNTLILNHYLSEEDKSSFFNGVS